MKKIILTLATPNILPHCAEILDNQRGYAAACGYEHRLETGLHWPDLHPSFSKVWEVHKAMGEGYDIILWADADVAFMYYGRDLATLLEPDYFLAAYQQTNWKTWAYLCNGLMVWRNCEAARKFNAELMRRVETRFMKDPPWEQWYFDEIVRETAWKGVRCCDAAEIGCFAPEIWHDGTIWQPGYPTVHLAGPATWPRRREVFLSRYAPLVRGVPDYLVATGGKT